MVTSMMYLMSRYEDLIDFFIEMLVDYVFFMFMMIM
jgi:hypothetical protein